MAMLVDTLVGELEKRVWLAQGCCCAGGATTAEMMLEIYDNGPIVVGIECACLLLGSRASERWVLWTAANYQPLHYDKGTYYPVDTSFDEQVRSG